jgi:hypothetical protein
VPCRADVPRGRQETLRASQGLLHGRGRIAEARNRRA